MRKLVIATLITLIIQNASYAFSDIYRHPSIENTKEQQELEDIQKFFYEAPIMTREVNVTTPFVNPEQKELGGMPLFKQMRIKINNHFRTKAHEEMLEQKRLEEEELKKLLEEDEQTTFDDIQKENLKTLIDIANTDAETKKEKHKFKLFKRNKKSTLSEQQNISDTKTSEEHTEAKDNENLKFESGIAQVEAEKDAILDCEVVNYLDKTNEIEALGRPTLTFPTQNTTIIGDRITYNTVTNVIKAFDNVEVIRDGHKMYGDYMQINLNEENAFMDNFKSKQPNITVYADTANATDDLVVLEQGLLKAEESYILRLQTQFLQARIDQMVIPEAAQSHLDELSGNTQVKIVTKNIKIVAKDEHDVITMKKGNIQFSDSKLFNFRHLNVHTNKNHNFVETNIPEFGSRARIGMFAGPGYVFDAPFASTIKVMPLINYKDKIGFGGALRYSSATNRTDMMYGSAENIFVMRGKQYLDDKLLFQYGVNSYVSDWWMGQRMAKYLAELVYMDGTTIPDFLGKNRPLIFQQRLSAGYMHDTDINRFDERIKSPEMGTTRFKYMASIAQNFYSYHNKEKRLHLDAALAMQGSAALYGTGDTQFVGRIGPLIHTQYKYWMQDLGYFLTAYDDRTPLPRYDCFRYGKSNVYLREALRVNKYLTVAYATSINLSNDAPNNKEFQENAFIISLGPDDFKVNFGYDFMRKQTYFTLAMALDTKGSSIEYDKMEIVHPEKLGRNSKQYVKPVEFPEDNPPARNVKRKYAEVIPIEDPNKEQL